MKLAWLILVAVTFEFLFAVATGRFIHVGQHDDLARGDRRG